MSVGDISNTKMVAKGVSLLAVLWTLTDGMANVFRYATRVTGRATGLAYPVCVTLGLWTHIAYEAYAGGMQQLLLSATGAEMLEKVR